MFTKLAICFLSLSPLVLASPLFGRRGLTTGSIVGRNNTEPISFNNWKGISSLDGFDSFNGQNNFDGSRNSQIIVVEEQQVVCHSQSAHIIQQRLAVLQELAKRIITEQVCEVETQTIIFAQFHDSMGNFRNDLQRQGGRQPGFDDNVAKQIHQVVNADGSLSNVDLGFKGSDVGNRTIAPGGSNWNNNTSPASVKEALDAAQAAKNATHTGA